MWPVRVKQHWILFLSITALFRAKVLCNDGLNVTRHLCLYGYCCFCYNYCCFCCYYLHLKASLVPLFFSTLEEIIWKFSQFTPQERAKRYFSIFQSIRWLRFLMKVQIMWNIYWISFSVLNLHRKLESLEVSTLVKL